MNLINRELIARVVKRINPPAKEELSAFLLQDLIQGRPFLPYTNSSLFFRSLLCIVNDLIINNRKHILEFGCGISTIILARAISHYEINATITTIEENADWIGVVRNYLAKEGLTDLVTFVHAPLEKDVNVELAYTYNQTAVKDALSGRLFDLVLIDGPSAWQKDSVNSRVSTLDLFKNNLSESFTIFVDNADRPGEKILGKNIIASVKAKKILISVTFQVYVKGQHFNFIL